MSRALPNSILIPVETLNREFDGKLLLSILAVQRGYKPIIGGRTRIHARLSRFPEAVYLSKGVRAGNATILRLIESLGHVIVALDEEALIRADDDALLMMLDEVTFNRCRLLYAWGDSNADVWRRYSGYRGTPVLSVGNPRMDLLRPEMRGYFDEDVARLRARFGNFVLFSSNFALVNHYITDHVRMRFAKDADATEAGSFRKTILEHKRALFEDFRTLLPKLGAAIAPHTLIIRPHPSEDHEKWKVIAEGHGNIHVVHEGPIVPWLAAATALLHSGCTSGVEAAVLDKPAFAFRPSASMIGEAALPNDVSISCADMDDLVDRLCGVIGGDPAASALGTDQKSLLRHHIASLDGALSCERILGSLVDHRDRLEQRHRPSLTTRLEGILRHHKRNLARAIRTRDKTSGSSRHYTAHKFPGISAGEVNQRIARFRRIRPDLPAVEARQLDTDIFAIERL